MMFARVFYDDAPEWGVAEGKYVRLIDGAPYEQWQYLGTEVRAARADFCTPVTGRLYCARLAGGTPSSKTAARVPAPGEGLPCPKEGMEALCGLAALYGADGVPYGFAAYGGGALGAWVLTELPEGGMLSVLVGGKLRGELLVSELRKALLEHAPLAQEEGDAVAAVQACGLLLPGDTMDIRLGAQTLLRDQAVRR